MDKNPRQSQTSALKIHKNAVKKMFRYKNNMLNEKNCMSVVLHRKVGKMNVSVFVDSFFLILFGFENYVYFLSRTMNFYLSNFQPI